MAFDKKGLDDYVDVAARITEFRAKYPDGYLAPLNPAQPYLIEVIGDRVFVVVVAAAYRGTEDRAPGVGMAWEPFPGQTPYTRNSELMNAETSAWGRAIIALGAADSKRGIASREEVRNRQEDQESFDDARPASRGSSWQAPANPHSRKAERSRGPMAEDPWASGAPAEDAPGTSTPQQHRAIAIRLGNRGLKTREEKIKFCQEVTDEDRLARELPPVESSKDLSYAEAVKVLKLTEGANA
jgi:hypothetical protein